MPLITTNKTYDVPRWLLVAASGLIAFHLLALTVRVLAADSGPWPNMEGSNMAAAPRFAFNMYQSLPGDYLKTLQMTHNYHFTSDRPARTGIYLEARLKDKDGNEIARLKLPEDGAGFWLRHRQELLAEKLGNDEPVPVPMSERVPAPNRPVEMVTIWDEYENRKMRLKKVELNSLIGSNRPHIRPSELAMLYARAYARYLCREHGAASVEIIRHHQDPIPPGVLFDDNLPAGAFDEAVSNFGEFPR